jgi:hypothetical protein
MKRWINWSSEDLNSQHATSQHALPPSLAGFEPTQKRQRSMNLKASMKSLFRSVKKIIPGHRQSKQAASDPYAHCIQKTAAMREADDFLARLGGQWKPEDLEGRIAYLYKVIDDSFERVRKEVMKGNAAATSAPPNVVREYMREIRALQALLMTCPKPVDTSKALPQSRTFYPETQVETLCAGYVVRSKSEVELSKGEIACLPTIEEIEDMHETAMECDPASPQEERKKLEQILDEAESASVSAVAAAAVEDITHLNDVNNLFHFSHLTTTVFKDLTELRSSCYNVPTRDEAPQKFEGGKAAVETPQGISGTLPIEFSCFGCDSQSSESVTNEPAQKGSTGSLLFNKNQSSSVIDLVQPNLELPNDHGDYRDTSFSSSTDIVPSASSASLDLLACRQLEECSQVCTKTGALISVDKLIDQFNSNTVLSDSKPNSRRQSILSHSSSSVLPTLA